MPVEIARLEAIFSEALAKSTRAARDSYLDAACGSNMELRGRVEGLLASSNSAGSFMAPSDLDQTIESQIPIHEKPGSKIGRYKLLEQIGEGGFGVVFMAEQERPVRRRVALKVIKMGMDTKQVVARFEAERQALAMMDHPNIARVFDAGATDTGRPYFVMELVKGIPITEYCDQRELSTKDRLSLFVDVCKAVQHAHQRGVIHRDIKPSNILLTLHDDKAVPKVIDFGIAKATQSRLTEKTLFTEFRQLIGTPAYMSPEQAQMIGMDIDTRSDIYSLGVMLYELLTGSTPFDSKQLSSGGLDEMRRVIREVEPPPPSSRLSTLGAERLGIVAHQRRCDPQRLGRLVEGDLDWIVMRCLEKDRTRRYDTAVGLAEDIQRHLSDEPVQARPPTLAYRTRKFVRRNKVGVMAGTAIATAILLGLAMATVGFIQARRQTEIARKEAARSQQTAQFLTDMLQGVGPSVAKGRDTTMLHEILDQTAEHIDKDLKDQPEVQIEVRLTLADTYHELGLFKQMEQMARGTLTLARSTLGEENVAVASALRQVADALGHFSRYQEAVPISQQSIALMRRLRGGDSLEEASALYHLAFGLSSQGKRSEAESTARTALAMRRRLRGAEHSDVARSLDGLSRILMAEQKLPEAESMAREALDMRKNLLGDEHPEMTRSFATLGEALKRQGRYAEAEALLRQGVDLQRKMTGEDNWEFAGALGNLAAVVRDGGNLAEAEDLYRQALPIAEKQMGDDHPFVANYCRYLVDILRKEGKPAEAEGMLRKFLLVMRKELGDEHPRIAELLTELASGLRIQGKLVEARPLVEESLTIYLRHPEQIETWRQHQTFDLLREILHSLGETTPPLEAATQIVKNLRATRPDDPYFVVALANLANCLCENGDHVEARPFAEEAMAICQAHPDRIDGWMFDRAFDAIRNVLTQLGDTAGLSALATELINRAEGDGDAGRLASAYASAIRLSMAASRQNEAEGFCRKLLALPHKNGMADNNAAWFLATAENLAYRQLAMAVELAEKAVELGPTEGMFWNTLGAAHYRAGNWQPALEAIGKSMEFGHGGNEYDWFFLAMTHWKLGDRTEARTWYEKAVVSMDKYQPGDGQLRRFRSEAAELIGEQSHATQP